MSSSSITRSAPASVESSESSSHSTLHYYRKEKKATILVPAKPPAKQTWLEKLRASHMVIQKFDKTCSEQRKKYNIVKSEAAQRTAKADVADRASRIETERRLDVLYRTYPMFGENV